MIAKSATTPSQSVRGAARQARARFLLTARFVPATAGVVATARDVEAKSGRWTQRRIVGPAPRTNSTMAHDSARGITVMFGGFGTHTDTWGWNGSTWAHMGRSR